MVTTYPWTASQSVITDFSLCDETGPPKQSLDGAPSKVQKITMGRANPRRGTLLVMESGGMDESDSAEDQGFDFINDQKFRTSLQSDYREILRCIETSAWKAVHVLAGSVVEAIFVDYLIASGYQKRTGNDPMKMELGAVISASKDEKVISQRTANLSSVVQSYRNLIHPGRVIRLNETR